MDLDEEELRLIRATALEFGIDIMSRVLLPLHESGLSLLSGESLTIGVFDLASQCEEFIRTGKSIANNQKILSE